MEFPNNLNYSKEHTWLSVEGDTGTVGITEFAQSANGLKALRGFFQVSLEDD